MPAEASASVARGHGQVDSSWATLESQGGGFSHSTVAHQRLPANHRGHTTLRTLLAVTAAATALAWLGPVALDGQPLDWAQDDHQAEWLQAQDLADAQASARAAWERSERDAAWCRRLHGESALVYTADDMPVCVPRRAVQPRGTHLASSAEVQP